MLSAPILRLRLGLSRPESDASLARASRRELQSLVDDQVRWWERRETPSAARRKDAMQALNRRSPSAFVFSAAEGRIAVWPKPRHVAAGDSNMVSRHRLLAARVAQYRVFLEHVLRRSSNRATFDFVLDVGDGPANPRDLPIFSFHKHVSSRNLLLPDVDFFSWYGRDEDPLAYEAKSVSAVFVGASTGGGMLTHEAIRDRLPPRLRAAEYFHGHPQILFRIAAPAQCKSPDVEQYLKGQPWFGARLPWRDHLRHRFLMSMDGNGATCSRVVRALRSNGVLLKFNSPFLLYYFPAMKAGREYVAIEHERDVVSVIERELAEPGSFKPVAEAGTRFARRYLSWTSVSDYAGLLLARYVQLL